MVTTNQKCIIETQKRNESKHNTKERNKKNYKNNPKTINKMAVSTYLSIITSDVKELKGSIKGQRVAEYIQKQDPSVCCQQETHFISKDTQIESKRKEKGISCKWKWKES